MSHQPAFSTGRGGAGNMGKERTASGGAAELVTPTLKSNNYTTGRGGSGNMAKNDYGAEARTAQDVDAPAGHNRQKEGEHYHYGRGGAANIIQAGDKNEKKEEKKDVSASGENKKPAGEKVEEKGKGLLEKIGLKK